MRWRKGRVIAHYDTGDPKRPWVRVVECEYGGDYLFDWGHLCRDRTGEVNTRVGAEVWVSERGVTAFKPEGVS